MAKAFKLQNYTSNVPAEKSILDKVTERLVNVRQRQVEVIQEIETSQAALNTLKDKVPVWLIIWLREQVHNYYRPEFERLSLEQEILSGLETDAE